MVSTEHPQYTTQAPRWREARHVLAGERAIKSAGETYLKRLEGDDDDAYSGYKERGSFFNATARTLEGFLGLIFRRDPFITAPKNDTPLSAAVGAFLNDVDLAGTSIQVYAKDICSEVIGVGRAGTLVDWSEEEKRAYLVPYKAEQIINWRTQRIAGRTVATLVVLKEPQEGDKADNPFALETIEQIRVLRLVDWRELPAEFANKRVGRLGQRPLGCVSEIWRKPAGGGDYERIETRVPTRHGAPLPLLPFVFHNPLSAHAAIEKLPLADLISVNLDHYRLTTHYRHGLFLTALPTPWAAGVPDGTDMPPLGSSTVWESSSTEFRCGFLEFRGDGLGGLERALDRDERLLAVLGSRLLEPSKRVGETAEAIELRQSGESSILASLAGSVGFSLTWAMRWVYWWHPGARTPEDVTANDIGIELNRDYSIRTMTAPELKELVAAFQAQVITEEELVEAFRRGEVIPPNSRRGTTPVQGMPTLSSPLNGERIPRT